MLINLLPIAETTIGYSEWRVEVFDFSKAALWNREYWYPDFVMTDMTRGSVESDE